GSNKMYQDLKQRFWWTRMKREIARYIAECDVCQLIKADHLKSAGQLQPLAIPSWKWEDIHMHFIVGLPRTQKGYDSIWVIVDRLTKIAYFIPVKTAYPTKTYAELYISRIVCLHGVPKTITSDRGPQFVARFWEQLQESLGTKLIHSSAYHPQTSGQVERVNQILEDMLRACVINFANSWDDCLPLAELSYNNSYHKSLQLALFEALYGRRCSKQLYWSFPNPTAMWTCGVSIEVATTSVVNARCVSRISAQEVLKSSFRSRRDRNHSIGTRSDLSRAPNQDSGSERTCYPKKIYQVV